MNLRIITSLVAKDTLLFFRNQFFALISGLGIVAYAAIYFLMPDTVDELLGLGVYAPALPAALEEELVDAGLDIYRAGSEEALVAAMEEKEYNVGVVLPEDLAAKLARGEQGEITVYLTSDIPPEIRDIYLLLFQELGFILKGETLNIEANEEILGRDMAGAQIPQRDRMLPLFAILIIIMETLGLGTLISEEVESGTVNALLITPMKVRELFVGKGITGTGMAFGQAAVLMLVMGGLTHEPVLILVTLLLSAVLVTGVGFMLASAGKDMMSVIGWGVPAIVILSIPTFGVMFPGSQSDWVKAIPSYYLVDTVHQVANMGAGWADMWGNLLILLAFDLALVWLGIALLRRKIR